MKERLCGDTSFIEAGAAYVAFFHQRYLGSKLCRPYGRHISSGTSAYDGYGYLLGFLFSGFFLNGYERLKVLARFAYDGHRISAFCLFSHVYKYFEQSPLILGFRGTAHFSGFHIIENVTLFYNVAFLEVPVDYGTFLHNDRKFR